MKQQSYFECQKCEAQYPRWQGQCQSCGSWNTLEEVRSQISPPAGGSDLKVRKIGEVDVSTSARIKLGIGEWDNALGGGILPGQVILLSGEPGVGKSTLLLSIAEKFQHSTSDVLYFAGEESLSQIAQRAKRLGLNLDKVSFVEAEADADSLAALIEKNKPSLLLVDSIQTLVDLSVGSPAGSLAQVRQCAQKITNAAKRSSVPVIMVGHINKEGNVAGPKVLEHIVDTNLFLEGEKFKSLRILRVLKNRFGPVDEVGIFEMTEKGLVEALNPETLFLGQPGSVSSGSCLAVVIEGTRPVLVEVQALTLPCKFGYPKRSVSGVSLNRLQTLLAVIEKRVNISLQDKDVYVSLAGGIKVYEPALDLPLCLAVISATKDKALGSKMAAFGEVGLSGEIRPVLRQEQRERQAKKLGIGQVVSGTGYHSLKEVLPLFKE